MPERKKEFVLLRGALSGMLIVGSRSWYDHANVKGSGVWELITEHDDYDVLLGMLKLSENKSLED